MIVFVSLCISNIINILHKYTYSMIICVCVRVAVVVSKGKVWSMATKFKCLRTKQPTVGGHILDYTWIVDLYTKPCCLAGTTQDHPAFVQVIAWSHPVHPHWSICVHLQTLILQQSNVLSFDIAWIYFWDTFPRSSFNGRGPQWGWAAHVGALQSTWVPQKPGSFQDGHTIRKDGIKLWNCMKLMHLLRPSEIQQSSTSTDVFEEWICGHFSVPKCSK